MEFLDPLFDGLRVGLEPRALFYIIVGVAGGILVGAAPGLGGTVGLAIALPFAIQSTPEYAIFLLVSILVGVSFGNSISAVLIRIPGTPAALLTVYEGNPFHQRGEGGRALLICLYASFVGQIVGILLFILAVTPLAHFAVRFLFPEIFAVTVFGLLAAGSLFGGSMIKGFAAVAIGLFLATAGPDPISGFSRYDMGIPELQVGIGVVPVLVGLLAMREVFEGFLTGAGTSWSTGQRRPSFELPKPSAADVRGSTGSSVLGSGVGAAVGALPGTGPAVGTFVSYSVWQSVVKRPEPLGKGSIRPLANIDAAQNAGSMAGLIPTLGIGVPGSAPMVLIMAALATQGLYPGPQLAQARPGLIFAVFGGLLVASVVLLVVGYLFIAPSVYISLLSRPMVLLVTAVLMVVGVYSVRWSMTDVWVAVVAGLIGVAMERGTIPVAPAALAFVLGGILETNLRRGLVMTDGFVSFLSRPITLSILILGLALVLASPLLRKLRAGTTSKEPVR